MSTRRRRICPDCEGDGEHWLFPRLDCRRCSGVGHLDEAPKPGEAHYVVETDVMGGYRTVNIVPGTTSRVGPLRRSLVVLGLMFLMILAAWAASTVPGARK